MNTSRRQLAALTGMRFFLALWVVVYHQSDSLLTSIGGPAPFHRALEGLVLTGYSAVSAFFILSGFVLAYNYDPAGLLKPLHAARFAIARFSRIYPAYAAGLLLLLPFAIYGLVAGVTGEPSDGPVNFILSVCLLQAWTPGSALSWNYPGWSLSDEAFFYALLPLIGFWIVRVGVGKGPTKRAVVRLLVLGLVFWALSLAVPLAAVLQPVAHFGDAPATDAHLRGAGAWANVIRYNPLLRLPEFSVGIVLALLYRLIPAGSRLWKHGARFYLPAIGVLLLVLANADRIPYPLMHNGLLVPAYGMLIFGLALEGGALVCFLSLPVLVFLGNVSYSIYILHAPVGSWMNTVFVHVLHLVPFGMFWLISYVAVVIAFSAVFYRVAEEPLHRRLRERLNAWAESRRPSASVQHT